MSLREQHGQATAASPLSDKSASSSPTPRNGDAVLDWESLFPALIGIEQSALLEVADRQGFLHVRQVPCEARHTDAYSRVTALLQGANHAPLTPSAAANLVAIDLDLDAWQRDAVARALATPDLCLIQGGPGTGKTRVIAEIIRHAARKGERVLFVAPTPAALDLALDRLAGDANVLALRGVARDERFDALPPASAERTAAHYRRELIKETVSRTRRAVEEAERRIARGRVDFDKLEQLLALAQRGRQIRAELTSLSPASPCANGSQVSHDAQLAQLEVALAEIAAERQAIQTHIAKLEPLVAEKQRMEAERGWLSRLLSRGAIELQNLGEQIKDQRIADARAKQRSEQLGIEREKLVTAWQVRQATDERNRAEAARITAELAELGQTLSQAAVGISHEHASSDISDPATLAKARDAVRQGIERDQEELAFRQRWGEYLNDHGVELPARLLRSVNLAVVPMSSLATDDAVAELTQNGPFDLVILDEAHRIPEVDLLAALRRGRRHVLVGEPVDEPADAPPPRNGRRHGENRSYPWARLWQQLHSEGWRIEAGRLRARLLPLTAAQCANLETEPVADSPDVELRIATPMNGTSALAEVTFPAETPIDQAVSYLYRELSEFPVSGLGRWEAASSRTIYHLFDAPAGIAVELETGLRARLAARNGAWRVAAIEFEPTSGWDRERAESWVGRTLRVADAGRTAQLLASHRMAPAVAAFAANLGLAAAPSSFNGTPAVEFIPVPALTNEPQARRRGDVGVTSQQRRLPALRGGAGFEVDLGDRRQRESLPAEIADLPGHGLVNPTEARAVIHLLENLIDDLPEGPDRPASIAVLALSGLQSELIRRLAAESPTLTACRVPLAIEPAGRFRQREADLVVVGLTRSHSHRAVSYGDHPADAPLALTRARRRLILVGDPGTLARRAQWEGPLDHLDAAAARREREWVAALVRLLQGHGPPITILREGLS